MKTLIISLVIWTFIIPLRNRHLLILTFLGAFMPNLYFALTGLVVAVATLAIMRELLWTRQSSREDSASDSTNHSQSTLRS